MELKLVDQVNIARGEQIGITISKAQAKFTCKQITDELERRAKKYKWTHSNTFYNFIAELRESVR